MSNSDCGDGDPNNIYRISGAKFTDSKIYPNVSVQEAIIKRLEKLDKLFNDGHLCDSQYLKLIEPLHAALCDLTKKELNDGRTIK